MKYGNYLVLERIIVNRINKLRKNTITSIIYQITLIVSGFILPSIIIGTFGSETNGLVNSIKQFLQMIAFLEMGVGAVVQSALYKPLVDRDERKISEIVVSGSNFFKLIGRILAVYVIILSLFYNKITSNSYSNIFVASLVIAISISYFAQYYFGLMDMFLLQSDQKGYIVYCVQIITIIINVVFCVCIAKMKLSIQFMQFFTSFIYLIRPLIFRLYINRHYKIDRHIKYTIEPIKQKWDGIAQHIAAVVIDSTDIVVLTIFSTLNTVSVYSIYNMVISGVRSLISALTQGMQALLGELWAREEYNEVKCFFYQFEWLVNLFATFIWSCTVILLIPFVKIYTYNIGDINYIYPLFSLLITIAYAVYSFRLPYNTLILAVGHYKETRMSYIIAATMNIVLSCIMVKQRGLVGVAIGTLISMTYQLIWMAFYCYKKILKTNIYFFLKQIFVNTICIVSCILVSQKIILMPKNYLSWIILAVKIACINLGIVLVYNLVFYKDNSMNYLKKMNKLIKI